MAYELEYDLLTELEMVEGESAPEYVNVVARKARLEIERLRIERDDLQVLLKGRTAEFQAEIERLRAERDAERALADDLYAVLSRLQPLTNGSSAQQRYLEARRG
jgi:hypothetical protein